MHKKYIVGLTDEGRARLLALTSKGRAKARTIKRANMLLLSAEGQTDAAIAALVKTTARTVARIRKEYSEAGLDAALNDRPRSGRPQKLDGKQEALLVAFACSDPPEGRTCWTMQLLADKMVTLEVIGTISDETVRRTLKKTGLSRGNKRPGVSRT